MHALLKNMSRFLTKKSKKNISTWWQSDMHRYLRSGSQRRSPPSRPSLTSQKENPWTPIGRLSSDQEQSTQDRFAPRRLEQYAAGTIWATEQRTTVLASCLHCTPLSSSGLFFIVEDIIIFYSEYQLCNQEICFGKYLSLLFPLCSRFAEGRIKVQNGKQEDGHFDCKVLAN